MRCCDTLHTHAYTLGSACRIRILTPYTITSQYTLSDILHNMWHPVHPSIHFRVRMCMRTLTPYALSLRYTFSDTLHNAWHPIHPSIHFSVRMSCAHSSTLYTLTMIHIVWHPIHRVTPYTLMHTLYLLYTHASLWVYMECSFSHPIHSRHNPHTHAYTLESVFVCTF